MRSLQGLATTTASFTRWTEDKEVVASADFFVLINSLLLQTRDFSPQPQRPSPTAQTCSSRPKLQSPLAQSSKQQQTETRNFYHTLRSKCRPSSAEALRLRQRLLRATPAKMSRYPRTFSPRTASQTCPSRPRATYSLSRRGTSKCASTKSTAAARRGNGCSHASPLLEAPQRTRSA